MKTLTKTTKPLLGAMICVAMLSASSAAWAGEGTAAFDKQMGPIVAAYGKIHVALSGDSTKGVAKAAAKIAKLSRGLKPKTVKGKHAGHYAKLPATLRAAAVKLSKAKGIDAQREAFKAVSRPMAMWATMSKPAGVNVVFCSMAKGSWLQTDKKIRNPYYGKKMLTCGQIIGGDDKGHAGGHMGHGKKMEHGKNKKMGHGKHAGH